MGSSWARRCLARVAPSDAWTEIVDEKHKAFGQYYSLSANAIDSACMQMGFVWTNAYLKGLPGRITAYFVANIAIGF